MVFSLKALCQELDSILITYFEAFDETIKLQNELNALMKDGFLYMSKARVNMGVQSVSKLQYPEEMTALIKVQNVLETSEDESLEDVKFEMCGPVESKTETEGLRHRGEAGDMNQRLEDLEISKPVKNPIKWFGVLVPQTLRDAQARFKRAAEISIDLASKKAEMELLRKKYHQLHFVKEDIINSE